LLTGSCWESPHIKKLPDALLADSDEAAGDMGWRGVATSMVSRILPDRAFPCSSLFDVGDVGVVESSDPGGSDNNSEPFVRFDGASRVAGISVVTMVLSVIVCG
jgi:hypothetical protein